MSDHHDPDTWNIHDTPPTATSPDTGAAVDDAAPVVQLVTGDDRQERSLREDLIDAHDGDPLSGLRVELAAACRAEEDAWGKVRAADAKVDDLRSAKKTFPGEKAKAAEDVAALRRAATHATAVREAIDARVARAISAGPDAGPSGRLLRYSGVEEFVREYALPNWEHIRPGRKSGPQWCASWWCHAAAVAAFSALWESFETARLEPPPSLAAWMRDYLWPFMRELTSEEGPFAACAKEHRDTLDWPTTPPPVGWFPVYASETQQINEHDAKGA